MRAGRHVIVWRYAVAEVHRDAFERGYGSSGPWGALFATAPGYGGTELVRGERAGDYLTVDHWESKEQYDAFRAERVADYERLDAEFEDLTESETLVFEGTTVEAMSRSADQDR